MDHVQIKAETRHSTTQYGKERCEVGESRAASNSSNRTKHRCDGVDGAEVAIEASFLLCFFFLVAASEGFLFKLLFSL